MTLSAQPRPVQSQPVSQELSLPALAPCTQPTMYFIGVTTGSSSIMKIFPKWSDILGLGAQIRGYDAPLAAPAAYYRHIVEHIKADPLAKGALITTHKIDLLAATRDLFDYLDPYALLSDEISCIAKAENRNGNSRAEIGLEGYAKDPITSGLAWRAFVPVGHWQRTNGHVLCFGAGGAATAVCVCLAKQSAPGDWPRKMIVVDLLPARLEALRTILARIAPDPDADPGARLQVEYILSDNPSDNDRLIAGLPSGSAVINATGMGKDRPGSPITDAALFPMDGLVWELNYRGQLDFLKQARHAASERHLHIEDGWVYFLHGWSQVIAQVFGLTLTPDLFSALDNAAAAFRT